MKQFTNIVLLPLFIFLRLFLFIAAAIPLLIAIVLFFAIERSTITSGNWSLSPVDIQRAKVIVQNNHSDAKKSTHLSEKDLNIALSYLLNYYTPSTSQIKVENQQLQIKFSLFLTQTAFGHYLNFSFNLTKNAGYPIINTLKIGGIKIADEFAGLIIESIIEYTPLKEFYVLAAQHIKELQIHAKGLTIQYITSDDLSLKTALNLNNKSYNSVLFYQQKISTIVANHNPKWRLSLAELLQPLFLHAFQRSTLKTAISENRAVLIAVSTYVNKREIQAFIPFDISPAIQQQYATSLYKRTDMAKHFMVSAVLASTGAESLANYLGVEKEINDAKQGSGFSFIDLAGDRAGLYFGKMAVTSNSKARYIQKKMAFIEDYTAFMPEVRDLPENMNKYMFKRQFDSIYSAKYQAMLKKIDDRIYKLAIYQ